MLELLKKTMLNSDFSLNFHGHFVSTSVHPWNTERIWENVIEINKSDDKDKYYYFCWRSIYLHHSETIHRFVVK